jgi:hypothetical protein
MTNAAMSAVATALTQRMSGLSAAIRRDAMTPNKRQQ